MATAARLSHAIEGALRRNGFDVMIGACSFPRSHRHWHSGLEIAVIHSGVVEMHIGGARTTLLPGEAVIHAAEVEHGSRGEFSRTVVHFVPDMVPLDMRPFLAETIADHGYLAFQPLPHRTRRILWAAQQLAAVADEPAAHLTAKALIGLVVAEIHGALAERSRERPADPLRNVLSYMHSQPGGAEKLEAVAERFGISRSHLAELFAERIGMSPGAYWLRIRLEHACALLEEGHTVDEVARRVGFQSARGFQRAFQRVFRMTPSEYRLLTAPPAP